MQNVALDEFVIMPNHLHGIVLLGGPGKIEWEPRRDLINQIPTDHFPMMKSPKQTLGKVIRHFKARAARILHRDGVPDFGWQRKYYDRIIRDDDELDRIREYIIANPSVWAEDKENPSGTSKRFSWIE